MSTYLGKAPLTLVPTTNGAMAYVYAGHVAPEGIVPADLKRLVDEGFLVKVPDLEDPLPVEDPLADQVAGPTVVVDQPAKTAPKDAWVDFAVAKGATREDADKATKQELIDAYGV